MKDNNSIPGVENLETELNSGIESLKGLVARKASDTQIGYQTKVIQGTLDDLIDAIYPKELKEDKADN